jgi:hypothetical protein
MNKIDRDQVAKLILTDFDGNDLVISSALETSDNGSMSFEVMRPPTKERYLVTIKIEEI